MFNLEKHYKIDNIKSVDKTILVQTHLNEKKKCFTNIILDNINIDKNIYNLFNDISNLINQPIIYSIKNTNNIFNIEIYFYNSDNLFFFSNIIKIINILNIYSNNIDNSDYNDNIKNLDKIFNNYEKIEIISFSLDIKHPFFNYKMFIHTKIYDKYMNSLKSIFKIKENIFNSYNSYIIEYNLINNTTIYDSFYVNFNNYEDLKKFIKNYQETLFNNLNQIIEILKNISENPKSIIFFIRFETKELGIYLIENNFNSLIKFLTNFNYKKLFDLNDENLKDKLLFDIFINYNLLTDKINSTGFFDYY